MTSIKVNTTEEQKLTFQEIRDAALSNTSTLSIYQMAQLMVIQDETEFYKKLKQFVQ